MAMMRKTITIPDAMEEWVKNQIAVGRYGNDSEYIRDLIRRDQERKQAETQLGSLIDEALASGISTRTMQDIRHNVLERLKQNGTLPSDT